jgi:hypothetical protein
MTTPKPLDDNDRRTAEVVARVIAAAGENTPDLPADKLASPHAIVWDGMDGCWTNCTGEVSRDEALRTWAKETDGGTQRVKFDEIDYYRIFPGGTRMAWDGSEGREMFR